jgi:hypothetical protein
MWFLSGLALDSPDIGETSFQGDLSGPSLLSNLLHDTHRLDDQGLEIRFPSVVRDFSLFPYLLWDPGSLHTSGYECFFGGRTSVGAGVKAGHSPPPSAEVKIA